MTEQMFAKNSSEKMKEHIKKAFSKLEPVSKMRPNPYEYPITTIRRILGDNFYEMKDTSDDLLKLIIFENGGFNIEEHKNNIEKASELISFISMWFQGFLEANSYSQTFTPDFMAKPIAKVCITSPEGLICKEISMNDIKSISLFGDNGVVLGMKNVKEIMEVTTELQKNEQAIHQIQQTGNTEATNTLISQKNEYLKKLSTYQVEIIENFFNLIQEWSGVKDIKSVYDISIMFAAKFTSPDNTSTIAQTTLYTYHDGGCKTVNYLRNKFNLNDITSEE
jgi:hypothetical protein